MLAEEEEEGPKDLEHVLAGDDPFSESDLPLEQLAEPPEDEKDESGELENSSGEIPPEA